MHNYSDIPTFKTLQDIAGKNVTIMGLGLHGGGEACVRFFVRYGANVTVTDLKSEAELEKSLVSLRTDKTINQKQIRYVLGEHRIEDFENADVVIKNPGVKFEDNKYLAVAKNIETDLSLFLHFSPAPIIAVTGSKGKSSTVSAIHYALTQAGFNSFLGGNITVSPLTFLEQTTALTPVILELSSWQLSDLRGRKLLKPKIAVITHIVPDHQNWYHSMEKYVADKKLIYADQGPSDYTILNFDDDWGKSFSRETKGTVAWYSHFPLKLHNIHFKGVWQEANGNAYVELPYIDTRTAVIRTKNPAKTLAAAKDEQLVLDKLLVPGKHTRENIMVSSLVVTLLGLPPEKVKTIMSTYPGIPHRLEHFHKWECNNKTYSFYNDSAATVPEAASAALDSFKEKIHFVCGGTDKQLEFEPLAENISKAKSIWLLAGTGTDKLIKLLGNTKYNGPYNSTQELLVALKQTLTSEKTEASSKKEIVLFSPGATSFGMFKNEFDRGDTWKANVKTLF